MSFKHPMQPLEMVGKVLRFKENKIVSFLLEFARRHGTDLNTISCMDFSKEDRQQFSQLTGYSLDGYCDLSYADHNTYDVAMNMYENKADENIARLTVLEGQINSLKDALRQPMAELFEKHPDDLN